MEDYRFSFLTTEDLKLFPEGTTAGNDLAAKQLQYGFLTEMNKQSEDRLRIPELSNGFDQHEWCYGESMTAIAVNENGACVQREEMGEIPLTFVTTVPKEGNYQVEIELYADQDAKDVMIFLGRRRLAWFGRLHKGEELKKKLVTNICPIIPRNHERVMEDLTLDVTLVGRNVRLKSITVRKSDVKTLYIAGDSTVTDQNTGYPYLPEQSYCGWGQMLSVFLSEQMAVSNHSHSGLTTESVRSEGHYEILYDRIRPGDYCMFQFGHNDQKLMHLKAKEGYTDNLNTFIDEIVSKGATPILVSPLARNTWKSDGSYNDFLEEYAEACEKLARKRRVPYVDLHRLSMNFVKTMGREGARKFYFPSDYTHSNDYGAFLFAEYVYSEMMRSGLVESVELPVWEPATVPRELSIPAEYTSRMRENGVLFAELDRPEDSLTRAEALEMVITTMKFFPTNVYNDMFEDVIGHEKYAGSVECAYQNGIIPADWVNHHKIEPVKKITCGEFLEALKLGYLSRRPDQDILKHIDLGEMKRTDTLRRQEAAAICRQILI